MDPRLSAILSQAAFDPAGIPVILVTRNSKPLWLVKPWTMMDTSKWLQEGHSRRSARFVPDPLFPMPKYWTVPKAWLNDLTRRLVDRFGACYLVQALREREQCAAACWNAKGVECVCSCMGQHHGEGHPEGRWYEVSETCAVSWGPRRLHYKLLRARPTAEVRP